MPTPRKKNRSLRARRTAVHGLLPYQSTILRINPAGLITEDGTKAEWPANPPLDMDDPRFVAKYKRPLNP